MMQHLSILSATATDFLHAAALDRASPVKTIRLLIGSVHGFGQLIISTAHWDLQTLSTRQHGLSVRGNSFPKGTINIFKVSRICIHSHTTIHICAYIILHATGESRGLCRSQSHPKVLLSVVAVLYYDMRPATVTMRCTTGRFKRFRSLGIT